MKYTTTRLLFSLVLAVCSLALFSADTSAVILPVTKTADDSTYGSLRYAITEANRLTGEDTINIAIPGCTGSSICTINLGSELPINGKLTIRNSTGANRLLISGNSQTRVFYLNYGADLTLEGVTITRGNATNYQANKSGGAAYCDWGTKLTLINSAVTNSVADQGGAIYFYGYFNGSLTLTNSTVSGNYARSFGGGIFSTYGITRITNSTISGNTAATYAGGIYNGNGSTLNLTNVTVTKNHSESNVCPDCAGGIFNYRLGGTSIVNLFNTIVAGNTITLSSAAPDFSGAVSAASSNNIIGNNQLTTGIRNGENGNQVGVPVNTILNSLLAENNGTTETHALLPFSPAIDRGADCVMSTLGCDGSSQAYLYDQRGTGYPRKSGSAVDVGAFESAGQVSSSFDVSGTVIYGTTPATQPQKFVPGVKIDTLSGSSLISTTSTDATGNYMIRNLIVGGQYLVKPSKSDHVNGITAGDATIVLRHVAANTTNTFTPNQFTAADANGSRSITSIDATHILRFAAVGAPTPGTATVGSWKFAESSRNYGSLANTISGQNYQGILVGDVNGNWTPPLPPPLSLAGGEEVGEEFENDEKPDSPRQPEAQVQAFVSDAELSEKGGAVIVPVTFTNNSRTPISSFTFAVTYDPSVLQPDARAVDLTGVLSNDAGCAVFVDTSTPGRIGIAASCPAIGITGTETQLNLHFTVIGKARSRTGVLPALTFSQTPIFEDSDGQVLSTKIVSFSGK